MNTEELALKYRPTQLSDVTGQAHVIDTFLGALNLDRFSSSYMFAGPKGTGKTTLARILATIINCESVKDGRSCGECIACTKIKADVSPDVIELNGASKTGVDNMRDILEAASVSPMELRKKVYIIDECHRLTTHAESALLKDLEECPPHVVFILCTTDTPMVLDTILDRCQTFEFRPLNSSDIASRLQVIVNKEGFDVEPKGLETISRNSRGSLRKALVMLDQVHTAKHDSQITDNYIQNFFSIPSQTAIINIVDALITSNVALILDNVNDMMIASVDPKVVLFELSEVLRTVMVLKAQKGEVRSTVDRPDHEVSDLNRLGKSLKASQLVKLAHIFGDVGKKLEFNINKRWIMEATLIDCILLLRK
jgi:DNA polymerase-3 subunit gamma/tau